MILPLFSMLVLGCDLSVTIMHQESNQTHICSYKRNTPGIQEPVAPVELTADWNASRAERSAAVVAAAGSRSRKTRRMITCTVVRIKALDTQRM
jgi:hypothetical protein